MHIREVTHVLIGNCISREHARCSIFIGRLYVVARNIYSINKFQKALFYRTTFSRGDFSSRIPVGTKCRFGYLASLQMKVLLGKRDNRRTNLTKRRLIGLNSWGHWKYCGKVTATSTSVQTKSHCLVCLVHIHSWRDQRGHIMKLFAAQWKNAIMTVFSFNNMEPPVALATFCKNFSFPWFASLWLLRIRAF